jgi:hypothetical protein
LIKKSPLLEDQTKQQQQQPSSISSSSASSSPLTSIQKQKHLRNEDILNDNEPSNFHSISHTRNSSKSSALSFEKGHQRFVLFYYICLQEFRGLFSLK